MLDAVMRLAAGFTADAALPSMGRMETLAPWAPEVPDVSCLESSQDGWGHSCSKLAHETDELYIIVMRITLCTCIIYCMSCVIASLQPGRSLNKLLYASICLRYWDA